MPKFYYIMDPMCSWCYAFAPELETVLAAQDIPIQYVMGGLAPDSDAPMPNHVKQQVQQAWHAIEQRTNVSFNYDFWEKCQPRRSTYPACRAVIAASAQGEQHIPPMIAAIQQAYYQQARNPSNDETLIALADEIGLDAARFAEDLNSSGVNQRLQTDFNFKDRLGVQGFPALVFEQDETYYGLSMGWSPADVVMTRLESVLAPEG